MSVKTKLYNARMSDRKTHLAWLHWSQWRDIEDRRASERWSRWLPGLCCFALLSYGCMLSILLQSLCNTFFLLLFVSLGFIPCFLHLSFLTLLFLIFLPLSLTCFCHLPSCIGLSLLNFFSSQFLSIINRSQQGKNLVTVSSSHNPRWIDERLNVLNYANTSI